MSKFNVGDKVYLEGKISEYDASDNTYCVEYSSCRKGTRLTFWIKDDVLHTTDESYNKGLNDAWKLAKKIAVLEDDGGYSCEELKNIFGHVATASVLKVFTPQEALAKVKAYEERNEIKVGDVVRSKGCSVEGIVTKVYEIKIYRLFKDGSCDSISTKAKEDLVKTGKHFDSIDEFMRSAD
jgi:hypothetical protein